MDRAGWGKTGQGLCPWTPLRAQPLEPSSFSQGRAIQARAVERQEHRPPLTKTNGFQRLSLWRGSRGQSPLACFLPTTRPIQLALITALATCSIMPHQAVAAGLTVYARLDFVPAVGRAFTAQTGVAVRVLRPPASGLLARIVADGDHPQWSVAWFYGAQNAVMLDQHGLLAQHMQGAAGVNDAYVPTGIGLGGVVVMGKSAPFAAPATWADLTRPAYRGLIGINDPATSEQGFAPVASLVRAAGGWPAAQGYFLKLKDAGLHIYSNTATTLAALRSGAIQIAIVRSSAALHAVAIDPSLRVVVPQPATALTTVMVMAKNLPAAERADAARFIAYATSPAGIRIALRHGGNDADFWPISNAVPPPPAMQTLSSPQPAPLDPIPQAQNRAAIIAWFAKIIVGAST
jgi:iron(III) transport system substrate-binding protein